MSENSVDLSQQEQASYTVTTREGKTHSFDPFEAVSIMVDNGVIDEKGEAKVGQRKLVDAFREAIGLPSLPFSDAIIVLNHFQSYIESAEKKLLGSPNSPPSTDGGQPQKPTPRLASDSGETSQGSGRKSA